MIGAQISVHLSEPIRIAGPAEVIMHGRFSYLLGICAKEAEQTIGVAVLPLLQCIL